LLALYEPAVLISLEIYALPAQKVQHFPANFTKPFRPRLMKNFSKTVGKKKKGERGQLQTMQICTGWFRNS